MSPGHFVTGCRRSVPVRPMRWPPRSPSWPPTVPPTSPPAPYTSMAACPPDCNERTPMAEHTSEQIEKVITDSLISFGANADDITREAELTALDIDSLDLA